MTWRGRHAFLVSRALTDWGTHSSFMAHHTPCEEAVDNSMHQECVFSGVLWQIASCSGINMLQTLGAATHQFQSISKQAHLAYLGWECTYVLHRRSLWVMVMLLSEHDNQCAVLNNDFIQMEAYKKFPNKPKRSLHMRINSCVQRPCLLWCSKSVLC